jgi:hypothetical protein
VVCAKKNQTYLQKNPVWRACKKLEVRAKKVFSAPEILKKANLVYAHTTKRLAIDSYKKTLLFLTIDLQNRTRKFGLTTPKTSQEPRLRAYYKVTCYRSIQKHGSIGGDVVVCAKKNSNELEKKSVLRGAWRACKYY